MTEQTGKGKEYDVVIIGAGPAGLFAALECVERGLEVLVVDMGKDVGDRSCPLAQFSRCDHCTPCNVMCGVGGSGTFSDGILNLRPDIGGDLTEFVDEEGAWDLVNRVDGILVEQGAPKDVYQGQEDDVEGLRRKAAAVGARFIDTRQRHIGSDRAPEVIGNFSDHLRKKGVDFQLETPVEDLKVNGGTCMGVLTPEGEFLGRRTILAPGRVGVNWIEEMVGKHRIAARYAPIDVGVRVEVPAIVMDPATEINRDPKFHMRSKRYDDFVRTFCTNPGGFVVKEMYDEGFVGTNGHSLRGRESRNTNFALLVRIALTEPLENTTVYGKAIAQLATTIGGGKPLVQRMGDLRRGRRSTRDRIAKNHVRGTLQDVTPGDISMALPHRITMDIIEGLEMLDEILPGMASDHTLLYAPEIKFYAMRLEVGSGMQTSVKGLHAAGDGTGLSRDIVNAAATGILAARGVISSHGRE